MLRQTLTAIAMVAAAAAAAHAQTLGESGFAYRPGTLERTLESGGGVAGAMLVVWNPTGRDQRLHKPGFKVIFWGKATGCDATVTSGPVLRDANWVFRDVAKLTGVPPDGKHPGFRWTPAAADGCKREGTWPAGGSFVHVNEGGDGGIGLYTDSGSDRLQGGKAVFFRQFGGQGQQDTGANKYIIGTFVTFRFDWKGAERIYPFGAPPGPAGPSARLRIETVQAVPTAGVPLRDPGSKAPNQAKQQFAVTIVNGACLAERRPGALCQVKYLLHSAVFREGVKDWQRELWFDKASLLLDPAQGGLAVLHGPIKPAGVETFARDDARVSLWKSAGAATQHEQFEAKSFAVEISFRQFLDGLRIATARMDRRGPRADILDENVRARFGAQWNEPASWQILDLSVAQEVHNKDLDAQAWIGGSVRSLVLKGLQ